MSVSLSPASRTNQIDERSEIEDLFDQTAFLALFVSVVGLILTKGPVALMMVGGILGSLLRLTAPIFQ